MKKLNILLLLIFIAVVIFILLGLDNTMQTTNHQVEDRNLPLAFDGYNIAQISDLHCKWLGKDQSELINAVKDGNPDMIVLTGDIIDADKKDYDSVSVLVKGLAHIAPVYAVFGNHEEYSYKINNNMRALYKRYGVNLLMNNGVSIQKGTDSIYLYGLDDCGIVSNSQAKEYFNDAVPQLKSDTYGILLYHRSSQFDYLTQYGFRLVISGHLHGGLIRIPLIGGLLSPDKSSHFFPKYAGGVYKQGETTLISSRGFAGSHSIPRLYNRPELVFITLTR